MSLQYSPIVVRIGQELKKKDRKKESKGPDEDNFPSQQKKKSPIEALSKIGEKCRNKFLDCAVK